MPQSVERLGIQNGQYGADQNGQYGADRATAAQVAKFQQALDQAIKKLLNAQPNSDTGSGQSVQMGTRGSQLAAEPEGGSRWQQPTLSQDEGSAAASSNDNRPGEVYKVDGLADRQKALRDLGASDEFIASAMMESEHMTAKDAHPVPGDGKRGGAYNVGMTNMNTDMVRRSYKPFQGMSNRQIADRIDNNPQTEIEVYNAAREHFGSDWIYGQRGGATLMDARRAGKETSEINQRFIAGYQRTLDFVKQRPSEGNRYAEDIGHV